MWHNIEHMLAHGGEIRVVDSILVPAYTYDYSDALCIIEYIVYDKHTRQSLCKLHQKWLKYKLDYVWLPPSLVLVENLSFRRLDIVEEAFYNCWDPAFETARD